MAEKIVLEHEPTVHTLGYSRWFQRVMDEDFPFVENDNYTSNTSLDHLYDESKISTKMNNTEDVLMQHDNGGIVRVYRNYDDINLWMAANSRGDLSEMHDWIKSLVPEYEDTNKDIIPISFWANTANGPSSVKRKIDVPTWGTIRENYESSVQKKLDHIMNDFTPSHGGQLILWEGNPGTGKTYSLRALGDAWRDWAKFHYITDPEEFFGHASYMIQVLLQGNNDPYGIYDDDSEEKKEEWNVLILEDCGELLSADAKERTGQAVARLLNVVDGLIGQGLKILVLVTTNEPVKKFHPAVTRPGRMADHVEYKALPPDEANEWLKAHGSDETVAKATTLATLFGMAEGFSQEERTEAKVGFGS